MFAEKHAKNFLEPFLPKPFEFLLAYWCTILYWYDVNIFNNEIPALNFDWPVALCLVERSVWESRKKLTAKSQVVDVQLICT